MTSHENMSFSFQIFLHFLKFVIKSLIHANLQISFYLKVAQVLWFQNINFIERECLNFDGEWVEV